MRILSKLHQQNQLTGNNLSNSDKQPFMHQLNVLNNEMDQLKLQLNKVNQLLNDTISEKCKQELIYTQQQQQQQNFVNFSSRSDNGNLFRASLIPVGINSNNNNESAKSVNSSSIWKNGSGATASPGRDNW